MYFSLFKKKQVPSGSGPAGSKTIQVQFSNAITITEVVIEFHISGQEQVTIDAAELHSCQEEGQ